jgi:hypothetical protein
VSSASPPYFHPVDVGAGTRQTLTKAPTASPLEITRYATPLAPAPVRTVHLSCHGSRPPQSTARLGVHYRIPLSRRP